MLEREAEDEAIGLFSSVVIIEDAAEVVAGEVGVFGASVVSRDVKVAGGRVGITTVLLSEVGRIYVVVSELVGTSVGSLKV